MSIDPHTLIHRWFDEVWNQGNEQAIDELFPTHGIGHGLGEGDAKVRGPEEFKIFWRNMRSAFPDVHVRIEDTISDATKAVARVVMEGAHTGEGLGMPPTGRRVSVTGMVIMRFSDGQIVEGWQNWDQLGLLRQLGALPVQQAPDRFIAAQA